MKSIMIAISLSAWALPGVAWAQIESAPLPFDNPVSMRTMEAVCTGIGSDSRADPRWAAYPLRIEIAGRAGQFLGEAQVSLTKGEEAVVSVRCGGPWVLFKIAPGSYQVKAEVGGVAKTSRVTVGGKGQARVILRFLDQGGATSPEYRP